MDKKFDFVIFNPKVFVVPQPEYAVSGCIEALNRP